VTEISVFGTFNFTFTNIVDNFRIDKNYENSSGHGVFYTI